MESRPKMFGGLFELPEVTPDEARLREQYLIPAARAVSERWREAGGGELVALELPKGIERSEIIRDFEGLSCIRFTVAWTPINRGTEDEPDWELVHLGRVDVQVA